MQTSSAKHRLMKWAATVMLGLGLVTGAMMPTSTAASGRHVTTLDGHGGTVSAAKSAPRAPKIPPLVVLHTERASADEAAGVLRSCPC